MTKRYLLFAVAGNIICSQLVAASLHAEETQVLENGRNRARISVKYEAAERTYELTTNAKLRSNTPAEKKVAFSESPDHATIRTGNIMFDGLYALAMGEAQQNSVSQISDDSYLHGRPLAIEAYQTGELWKYVWTRDLSYSLSLALAGFDPPRAVNSLLFKVSERKASVTGGVRSQIIQDTGSGGSYPISADRVVWVLGADETLKYLIGDERAEFLKKVYPILCGTIEQDRRLAFDPATGLYRGEESFLDWREQTYPGWTKENVLSVGMSKAISVNVAMYYALQKAAEYSGLLKEPENQTRYAKWAAALKVAINEQLLDPSNGLYRSYLLSHDGSYHLPAARYDLLGLSMAILTGVADQGHAEKVIKTYPVGPFGPPVVWPEEKSVDIYHNQAIWPFVTAFWTKAAQKADNAAAVDAGIESLFQLAAFNLSNMENYDFVTGQGEVEKDGRKGPVVNSHRQLWSVAGYLSMVQDVVFGLETSLDGIRFLPFVPAKLRNEVFRSSDLIELRNLTYRGTKNNVQVHLPPAGSYSAGSGMVSRVTLNGKEIGKEIVSYKSLKPANQWEIFLTPPSPTAKTSSITLVNVKEELAIFAPAAPQWTDEGQAGLTISKGHVVLHYDHPAAATVSFDIYRDGKLAAQDIRKTTWIDQANYDLDTVHSYAITAVDRRSGLISHFTEDRSYRREDQRQKIPASELQNRGGNLVAQHHFENWGKPDHRLTTKSLRVNRSGRYLVRTEFSNGAGPVNTGITCAVKKLEIHRSATSEPVASGYLIMPQSGDWRRWDLSSAVGVQLNEGVDYNIDIFEDECCRNMSYLDRNASYTANSGGGSESYNYVNIASLQLLFVAKAPE